MFEQKGVDKLLVDALQGRGHQTLEDFASSFTTAKWETEARTSATRWSRSRARPSSGTPSQRCHPGEGCDQPPPAGEGDGTRHRDFEAPLDAAQKDQMAKSWTSRYGIVLTMHLCPADPLVNRLFREFRSNTPSLIQVNKMRSLYTDHNPTR